MRLVILLVFASGCRWLLGLDDAVTIDAATDDAEVILDADPSKLALTDVAPTVVFEGTGTGGGRPYILVIRGEQIVDGASVVIKNDAIGVGTSVVSADGRLIAAPIVIATLPSLGASQSIAIDVSVAQPVPGGGLVSQTLVAAITLQCLDELAASPAVLATGVHEFSTVDVSNVSVSDHANPLVIRARGSITITGNVAVSANGQTAGPGGNGGNGGTTLGNGSPGAGPGAGRPSGGGAGFAVAGQSGTTANSGGPETGSPSLPILGGANTSSGGAGGDSAGPGVGGAGGGGGGIVEITAGGTLMLGNVSAGGGAGVDGNHDGGGGSGGAVLLRGQTITVGNIDVGGGAGGPDGGAGSAGRVRLDTTGLITTTNNYAGPMFDPATPLISQAAQPKVTVRGQKNAGFALVIRSSDGSVLGPFPHTLGPTATAMFMLDAPLFRGLDTLCLLVEGAQLADDKSEGHNCIDVAYLP